MSVPLLEENYISIFWEMLQILDSEITEGLPPDSCGTEPDGVMHNKAILGSAFFPLRIFLFISALASYNEPHELPIAAM